MDEAEVKIAFRKKALAKIALKRRLDKKEKLENQVRKTVEDNLAGEANQA